MEHWIESFFDELQAGSPEAIDELRRIREAVTNSIINCPVYTFRNNDIASISGEIEDAVNPSDLIRLLRAAATYLDFQHVSISVISIAHNRLLYTRLATSLPNHWIQVYCDGNFFEIDPVLRKASEEEDIFAFSGLELSNPFSISYYACANKFGIPTNGICIPTSTSRGDKVAISFLSHAPAESIRYTCQRYGCDLVMLSKVASGVFLDSCTIGSAEGVQLSHDEIQFLKECLHSEGTNISAKENLPLFGTRVPIWNSVRRKLKVSTVIQAIALAHRVGWLDEASLRSEEVVSLDQSSPSK